MLSLAVLAAITLPIATGCAAPGSSAATSAAVPSSPGASPKVPAPSAAVATATASPDISSEAQWTFSGTLPAGWNQDGSTFAKSDNAFVEVLPDRSVMAADCALMPEPGIGRTATEIVDALASRSGLATTGKKPVTISGLQGQQLDFALAKEWTTGCPAWGEVTTPVVPLVGTLDEKNQWLFNAVAPGEQYRYLVLDVPGGGNVLISVYAAEPERLTDIIGPAMEIVDHLIFTAR
jgi:hypothetical protein